MFRSLLVAALVLSFAPAPAAAQKATPQVQVIGSGTFLDFTLNENLTGGVYLQGGVLYPDDAARFLFTYVGPELTIEQDGNIKLLTGTFMTAGGDVAALTSLWLSWANMFSVEDLFGFGEYDLQIPTVEDVVLQHFVTVEVLYKIEDDFALGAATELFFGAYDDPEKAIWIIASLGPKFMFLKRFGIWVAYDVQPGLEGNGAIILRAIFLHTK